jgi:hypothetical protein
MEHSIIIDTDSYSGNFEREMCAFITGQVGESEVGSEIVEKERSNIKYLDWWEEHIESRVRDTDDTAIYDICEIVSTPGCYDKRGNLCYNSVKIFISEPLSYKVLKELKERAKLFAKEGKSRGMIYTSDKNDINIIGFRVCKETVVVEKAPV